MLKSLTNNCFTIPSYLQKNFQVLIPNLGWPALIQSHSLPTLLCKKQFTSVLTIYLKIGLMLIICQMTLSASYLLRPCLNPWFYLIRQEFKKQHDGAGMGSLLEPTLANNFLCYHKRLECKVVLLNLNLLPIEGTLMIHFYFLPQNTTLKNSKVI